MTDVFRMTLMIKLQMSTKLDQEVHKMTSKSRK